MRSRHKKLLIRNERAKYLSYEQGFCARNAFVGNFIHKLITPLARKTFVNNSLHSIMVILDRFLGILTFLHGTLYEFCITRRILCGLK